MEQVPDPRKFVFAIGSRHFYNLETQAYASLWLLPPYPLDLAQLKAKAKTAPPTKATKPAK